VRFDEMMAGVRAGQVARRTHWQKRIIRAEGLALILVQAGQRPTTWRASEADREADDWLLGNPQGPRTQGGTHAL
jgi:hypothetical protein